MNVPKHTGDKSPPGFENCSFVGDLKDEPEAKTMKLKDALVLLNNVATPLTWGWVPID